VTRDEIIGDREAAEMFGIGLSTLQHKVLPEYDCPKGKVDVRKANPVVVGRKRRWRKSAILEVLSTKPQKEQTHEQRT